MIIKYIQIYIIKVEGKIKRILENAKYIGIIGVISLLLASGGAFGWGGIKTFKVMMLIIQSYGEDEGITLALIEAIDAFLIATALFLFSVSMYELFIADLDLPAWMLAHNLHELKAKLAGVIILVMSVKVLEKLVESKDIYSTFLFGLTVTMVSGMLIVLSHVGGKD